MPDGQLWLLRDTYTAQTAWAPRHVGQELRLARLGAFDAALGAIRADAEAAAARKGGDHDRTERARHPGRQLPGPARPLPAARTHPHPGHGRPAGLGTRHRCFPAPGHRRQHRTAPPPPHTIEPLHSAEPVPVTDTERDGTPSETATRIGDLAAQHQAFRQRTGQQQHPMTPRKDLDWAALGDTLPSWWAPRPDAILRPPKPGLLYGLTCGTDCP